ncbi:MAG: diguanylate cyclase [Pseudomonadota bacterium]
MSLNNLASSLRILIVDESRTVRTILVKHLSEHYFCLEAADGESAWETLLDDHDIRLVIAAISLPLLDGYDLLQRIQGSRLQRIREMPVLMISGDDEAARERLKRLGGFDCITRGLSKEALLARIAPLIKGLPVAQTPHVERRGLAFKAQDPSLNQSLDAPQLSRKEIELQAVQAMSKAMRRDSQVSVLALSLNQLNWLEQTYGAELVAQLQQSFARLIVGHIRHEDCLGAYGATEIILLLPDTSHGNCVSYAARLSALVEKTEVSLNGNPFVMSLSVGIANSPSDTVASAGALLELASQRLHEVLAKTKNAPPQEF